MPSNFEVRGEIIMPLRAFEALNEKQAEEGGKRFAESSKRSGWRRAMLDPRNYTVTAPGFLRLPFAGRRRVPTPFHAESLEALQQKLHFGSFHRRVCHSLDACVKKFIHNWEGSVKNCRIKSTASSSR